MKNLTVLSFALCVILFTGCAAVVTKSLSARPLNVSVESAKHISLKVTGSKVAIESKDWIAFRNMWYNAIKDEVNISGHRLTIHNADTPPVAEPGILVVVYINDYRWISAGARYALGVMIGDAFIDSKVSFVDLQSGRQIDERTYKTSSSGGQGIFSAMTAKQIRAICKEIVAEIRPR